MSDLKSQKNIAAKILKCGNSRVWIDPMKINDIEDAITTADIKNLIKDEAIKAKPKQGNSSLRIKKIKEQKKKGRRKGKGSKKGHVKGEQKRKWMKTIRTIRKTLTEMKEKEEITPNIYRNLYKKAKSGMFRSKRHLNTYIEKENLKVNK